MDCPKCGQTVRDVATFCTRCHATLRFKCPNCKNEQRHGGKCEKCGVDFMKFATVFLERGKSEHDAEHDRLQRRTGLIKSLLLIPFNGGVSLVRYFLAPKQSNK